MLNWQQIENALSNVKYLDWKIKLHREFLQTSQWADRTSERRVMYFIQVVFKAPDAITGKVEEQRCRWHLIDTDKGEAEVLRLAYKAIKDAVLHEMNENFYVNGVRVADPHLTYN
jgi:hypothetical protein